MAAVALFFVFRYSLRRPFSTKNEDDPFLSAYETAYLAGGPRRATLAAITRLVHEHLVHAHPRKRLLNADGTRPSADLHPLEEAVLRRLRDAKASPNAIIRAVWADAEEVGSRVRELELALSRENRCGSLSRPSCRFWPC